MLARTWFLTMRGHHCLLLPVILTGMAARFAAQADQQIYTDTLQNGWMDWGWATHSYSNTNPVHSGTYSVSVTVGAYQALYIAHNAYNPSPYTHLRFWVHGGTNGNQQLRVVGHAAGATQASVDL